MQCKCIDARFSTTRRLTQIRSEPDPCFRVAGELAGTTNCGGLRTRGLYKAECSDPIVTVITIAYNCAPFIEETILSVLNQTYSNIEYIVIDGGSADGTLDVIKKYDHAIDYWISEPDRGIYDAMNKGIRASTGQWLNCMNVKDTFVSQTTIQTVVDKYVGSGARFIYSDTLLRNGPLGNSVSRQKSDHRELIVVHQSAVYQKSLHREYGLYMVAKGLTISDYIFFSLLDPSYYRKADEPIALYDITGISTSKASFGQKFVIDYLLNGMPKYEFLRKFHTAYYRKQMEELLRRILGPSVRRARRIVQGRTREHRS